MGNGGECFLSLTAQIFQNSTFCQLSPIFCPKLFPIVKKIITIHNVMFWLIFLWCYTLSACSMQPYNIITRWIVRIPDCENPLIMVKSDGGFTYDTSDMAAIRQRLVDEKGNLFLHFNFYSSDLLFLTFLVFNSILLTMFVLVLWSIRR